MAPPALIDFFYEFASPYACLSALRIRTLAARVGVAVRWRPFLLGPIFRAEGLADSPLNVFPLRGAYARRDVARRGRRYGFEVRFPSSFPRNSVLASRVALLALKEGWGEAFSEAVYRAEFSEDEDIASAEVVGALVHAQGHQPERVLEAAQTPEVKAALRAQVEAAQALGVFGAPSFQVAGELFWGDDRLEDALDWARGQR
ncbi:MAG: 2-hydroxychromene-2-carboxylate isomerase [Myxococcaceae bacterium]